MLKFSKDMDRTKSIFRTIRRMTVGAAFLLGLVVAAVPAARAQEIDRWVGEETRFRFVPDVLQEEEGHAGEVQGYFYKTPGFPLWLMTDMGGPLWVDKEHFSVNSSEKDQDGVWLLDLSCVDSVNGFFNLGFAIDSRDGKAVLKLATPTEGDIALYQGKVEPYEASDRDDFRNEKESQEALEMVMRLDTLVPAMNFQVKLNSELYGPKSEVNVSPKLVRLWDPRRFESPDYEVICCEKHDGMWYVRLKVGEATPVSEEIYLDLLIDSWTGKVNYRRGMADRLRLNWRAMVDGRVTGTAQILPEKGRRKAR